MSVGNSKKTAKRARRMAEILARLEGYGVRPVETQWRTPHANSTKEYPYGLVDLDGLAGTLGRWEEMHEELVQVWDKAVMRAQDAETHLMKVGAWPIPSEDPQEAYSPTEGDFFEEGTKEYTAPPSEAHVTFAPDEPHTFTAPVARLNVLGRCGRILSNLCRMYPFGEPKPLIGMDDARAPVGRLTGAHSDGDSVVWVKGEFERTAMGFAHASALHLGVVYPGLDTKDGEFFTYHLPDTEEEADRMERWPHNSITVIRDWRINGAMFRPIGASSWDLPKARVDVFA